MPFTTETKFLASSDRVKALDMHPHRPLIIAALHTGVLQIWNYESNTLVKSLGLSEGALRACKFIVRENWIVVGGDDMKIRIIDAETYDILVAFEAHSDYIRTLVVHPTLPYIISAGDDRLIKVWDWENGWRMEQFFFGHSHYVMNIALNPRDPDMFVSVSLDKKIKLWRIGEETASMTIDGHEAGVNCVDFFGESQLVTGSDDQSVKIWDWKTGTLWETLPPTHNGNITSVRCFDRWIVVTAEDNWASVWHSETLTKVKDLNFEMGRCWSIQAKGDLFAIGWDSGTTLLEITSKNITVPLV